jgi:hypothetical protein
MTTIPLASSSLTRSSNLPGSIGRAVRSRRRSPCGELWRGLPYLVLLRAGFCLPPALRPARCALTAPFHPYPSRVLRRRFGAVYFLCHCPSSRPDRVLPGALPCGVRTFLPPSPTASVRKPIGLAGRSASEGRRSPGPLRAFIVRLSSRPSRLPDTAFQRT